MQLFENAILGVGMLPAITSTKENVLLSYCYMLFINHVEKETGTTNYFR
jgi:hypothetical protein